MSFMTDHGARLIDNGYPILPIKPVSKIPGAYSNGEWRPYAQWTRHCVRRTTEFELNIWSRWPDAGIGIACGDIVAIDIDIVQDREVVLKIDALARDMLGDTPALRIGLSPKRLLAYRSNAPFSGFKRAPLEILARGQQFVALGVHPETGEPYYWPGESLLDLDISELPLVTEAACRAFVQAAWELIPAELRPASLSEGNGGGEHISSYYYKGTLEALEDAMRCIPNPELPYDEWVRVGLALKGGLGDAAAVMFQRWSALASKNVPETTARLFSEIRPISIGAGTIYYLAGQQGWVCPAHMTMNGAIAWEEGQHPAEPLLDVMAAVTAPPEEQTNIFVPDAFRQCTGVIGRFVDYMLPTAPRAQPILAVGAAIAAIGVLAGRRYRSPTNLRTNVYVVGMAESAGGKDHARQCIVRSFMEAGLRDFIGGSRLASGSGLLSALNRHPASIFQLDEFGPWLKLAIDPRAPKHVAEIWNYLTELATSAGSAFLGAEYADQHEHPRQDIIEPCCVVHATTVPEPFWEALKSARLKDGSFARWLVFQTDDPIPEHNMFPADVREIPASLIDGFRAIALGNRSAGNPGNLADQAIGTPQPVTVGIEAAAKKALYDLSKAVAARQRAKLGSVQSALLGRMWEHVSRIAMIYAISLDPINPVVDLTAVRWADQIVTYCTETMIRDADRYVSDSPAEAQVKRVLEIIRRAGGVGLMMGKLVRTTRFLGGDKRRQDILRELISSEQIVVETIKPAGAGRPSVLIRIV